MTAFLIFASRIVRRGPGAAPARSSPAPLGRRRVSEHSAMRRPPVPRRARGSDAAMDLPLVSASFAAFALTLYVLRTGSTWAWVRAPRTKGRAPARSDGGRHCPDLDGNETWLVMAAIALFAGFPIAYGILLPALYLPLIVMLLALGIRGVTSSSVCRAPSGSPSGRGVRYRVGLGCPGAGCGRGALILGVQVEGDRFAGSVFDVLNPLALLTGCALLAATRRWSRLAPAEGRRRAANVCRTHAARGGTWPSWRSPSWRGSWPRRPSRSSARGWRTWIEFSLLAVLLFACAAPRCAAWPEAPTQTFVFGLCHARLRRWPRGSPCTPTWSFPAESLERRLRFAQPGISSRGRLGVTPVILAYSAFAYRVFRGKTPRRAMDHEAHAKAALFAACTSHRSPRLPSSPCRSGDCCSWRRRSPRDSSGPRLDGRSHRARRAVTKWAARATLFAGRGRARRAGARGSPPIRDVDSREPSAAQSPAPRARADRVRAVVRRRRPAPRALRVLAQSGISAWPRPRTTTTCCIAPTFLRSRAR